MQRDFAQRTIQRQRVSFAFLFHQSRERWSRHDQPHPEGQKWICLGLRERTNTVRCRVPTCHKGGTQSVNNEWANKTVPVENMIEIHEERFVRLEKFKIKLFYD